LQVSEIASGYAVWHEMSILVGGYGFILMSYAWAWMIAAGMLRFVSAERPRFRRADAKALLWIMAFWTTACAIMMLVSHCP